MQIALFLILSLTTLCHGYCDGHVRNYNGTCNSLSNPNLGSSGSFLIALEGRQYRDGIKLPMRRDPNDANYNNTNERVLSNVFFASDPYPGLYQVNLTAEQRKTGKNPESSRLNNLLVMLAQFASHDIGLTNLIFSGEGLLDNYGILLVDQNDPLYQVLNVTDDLGNRIVIRDRLFTRFSEGAIGPDGKFAAFTNVSAWLDLSTIYGSDDKVNRGLRLFQSGKLKFGPNETIPFLDETNSTNECGIVKLLQRPSGSGDIRVDNNPVITAWHTIFFREHNRICDSLAAEHPDWNDEQIYEIARKINIAQYQYIIFNELLPMLLGKMPVNTMIGQYYGYNEEAFKGVFDVFTTAAYRLHSMVNLPALDLDSPCQFVHPPVTQGVPTQERAVCIYEFFRARVDSIIRGAHEQHAQEPDHKVEDLFRSVILNIGGITGPGNFDIEAATIFRGREHGLVDFDTLRKFWLGISVYDFPDCQHGVTEDPLECFLYITSNATAANLLKYYYKKANNIDAYVGLLLEDSLRPVFKLGTTATVIIARQFKDLRDGDWFWYQNADNGLFNSDEIEQIEETSMTDIIHRNSAYNFQGNILLTPKEQNSCFASL